MHIDEEYLDLLSTFMSSIDGPTDIAVAGGAIRDMLFEKEVKDIDVFYTGDITWMPLAYGAKECFTKYDGCNFTLTYEIPANGVPGLPVPIQLIKVEDVNKTIQAFPSNICKCALFLDDGLALASGLLEAAVTKQFDYSLDKMDSDHFKRLKAKYSDWTWLAVAKPTEVPF